MHIEDISNFQAVAFLIAALTALFVLYQLIPGDPETAPKPRRYTEAEITRYDARLPKHFIAAFIALVVAGLHAALKSLPPSYWWLAEAGPGGHLARDIANTHLLIVVGGTIAATGLTWYALPRIARRPLWNEPLATASFWCTLLGAGGFYVVNIITGLILGWMTHAEGAAVSKEALGLWRAVPVGLTSTVMGIGYWTFVANVILTAHSARLADEEKPQGHLLKFFVVGALGLFIGTVQGVIQVLPRSERWLTGAGSAGEYIDPIAHAHVNLVTGALVLLAGLLFFYGGPQAADRRRTLENSVFWLLVPGSLLLYGSFMLLGFVEGGLIINEGITFQAAVDRIGELHALPLILAGSLTLSGLWLMLGIVAWRHVRDLERLDIGAPFVIFAMVVLFFGTLQGLIQLLPPVKSWLESAGEPGDAIANAHAQLNMIGGVLLAMMGLTISRAPLLIGREFPARLVRRTLVLVGTGIVMYYLAAIVSNIVMGEAIRSGQPVEVAMWRVQPLGPQFIATGAALFAVGFWYPARFAWEATAEYRRQGWADFKAALARYEGGRQSWEGHVPEWMFVAGEGAFGLFGFPGLGWILSGRPLIGLPLIFGGSATAYTFLPVYIATHDNVAIVHAMGPFLIVAYLIPSAALSMLGLGLTLNARRRRRERETKPRPGELLGGAGG